MSYDPFERLNHEEHAEFRYINRSTDGDLIRIERSLEEPGFDKLMEAFLDWSQAVYSWDRAVMKLKAQEAVNDWEI